MKIPRAPHRWGVSSKRAVAIQLALRERVVRVAGERELRVVAGVDARFTDETCVAAAVAWDVREERVVEERLAERKLVFPYVPGLLAFREAPSILAALRKMRCPVDAVLCDAHGIAHPRRFGLACHVGVLWNGPTVGCAKSLLVGEHPPVGPKRGSRAPIVDRGEIVGSVLRTRDFVRPVYVSIGHKVDLETAERLVLACAIRYRLPEPTRRADRLLAK
jgi:deoxyribonuclease V